MMVKLVTRNCLECTIKFTIPVDRVSHRSSRGKRTIEKKIYIYIRKWGRKRSSFDLSIQRQPDDGNGEKRGGRLLSLDPTSKKTVSSSRLITVLASKQAALLRDFKGCTRSWWRSNRESLHREGENRMQRKGEREKGRDERVPRQQLRVRFHQLTFSTLYWMATPNSKRHPHPPAPPNHTCSVCFRVIQLRPRDSSTNWI